MTIYSIEVTPLINMLIDILSNEYSSNIDVMADADDFSAARDLQDLRRWQSVLTEIGQKFRYYHEPKNIWLVVKSCALEKVEYVFFGTKTKITTEGLIILEDQSVQESLKTYTSRQKLMNGLANLSYCQRAVIELQSAYYAFTAGFKHKATISDICQKFDHCVE